MVMDQGVLQFPGMLNGMNYDEFFSNSNTMNGFKREEPRPFLDPGSFVSSRYAGSGHIPDVNPQPSFSTSPEGDPQEDSEIFSDIALTYISQMLMEEDIDEKINTSYERAALQATQKPFFDILGEKYPPSPDQPPLDSSHRLESPDDSVNESYWNLGSVTSSNGAVDSSSVYKNFKYQQDQVYPMSVVFSSASTGPTDYTSQSSFGSSKSSADYPSQRSIRSSSNVSVNYSSLSSFSSSASTAKVVEPVEDPLLATARLSDLFVESQPAWQFRKGVEEARKFLPSGDKLVIDLEASGLLIAREPKEGYRVVEVKAEEEEEGNYPSIGTRGRKNPNRQDLEVQEGRSNKQSAVHVEDIMHGDMFDKVLLYNGGKCLSATYPLKEKLQSETSQSSQSSNVRGSSGGKARGKKQAKKEVVDLRTLLIHCAQAVAADDRRNAGELLKQIRQHSSPFGDGSQRLAHCFADGLEARLAGTGSQIYHSLVAKRTTATDVLKAYHLYLAACPFKKISHFLANQTILNVAENAPRLHIIDFGIFFGFQWPCLIERLATRPGGPPKLRITGIDVPQPGFRPSERIEETGHRLADYAKRFNVPFEYNSIASKWETIRVEDLKIDRDEVLVVNCLYRFRNLVDETVVVDSPRNMVLHTIRKMNPTVFIHGIVNGSYSAPFFVTRFREALFHFSALFDMLETIVPREDAQRMLIERDLFGREALNVISCESSERVERPETYKQWQVRNFRSGFEQLPLNPVIMKKARDKVKGSYHKDFVIDEDSRWLLQGWKGRIIYAISTWGPKKAL